MLDAVVVGAGPNGLVAAIELARQGLSVQVLEAAETVGGGTRTQELTRPGFRHDVCAAFHPLGAVSPAFLGMPLHEHGLEWIVPDVQVAHPLDDGTAAAAHIDLEMTAEHLGRDGGRWRRLVRPITEQWERNAPLLLGPKLTVPPIGAALDLVPFALPATWVGRRLRTTAGAALFMGMAAHSSQRLSRMATAGSGLMLAGLAHRGGWPLARGGSAAITSALASYLTSLGGHIETGTPVRSRGDLPDHKVAIFNTAPRALSDVYDVPGTMARWIRRYRYGPGSYKVDFATSEPIPWTSDVCRRAGTVHVGGSAEEIVAAEAQVSNGVVPDRPFVLVGQQSLFDDSRAPAGHHTVWAYTHVPLGYQGSVVSAIESQIERFAPGFGKTILDRHVTTPRSYEEYNANYVGGDIATGALTLRQAVARPRLSTHPYSTSLPGVYLCSAATPPGPGVHGMSGYHAARAVLAAHFDGPAT